MSQNTPPAKASACSGDCACGKTLGRRAFVKAAGAGTLALLHPWPWAMAGPFEKADFAALVPADKKLSAEWVQSLFARGAPRIYQGEELKYIGMPIGGICSGQLYLGGDGTLWHWDIFNQSITTGADHYAAPMIPASPLEQGFSITADGETRSLDQAGFPDIRFRGEYPFGFVEYRDAALPVEIALKAFSPFIPLHADDSSLPVSIMQYTITNTGAQPMGIELTGRLENAVCLYNRALNGRRRNRVVQTDGFTFLEYSAEQGGEPLEPAQPDIVFENWDSEIYARWTPKGSAFGQGPIKKSEIPSYQGDVGGDTPRVVNSHATARGDGVEAKDGATGKLTSVPFTIERRFIQVWIGGGNHVGKTCINLIVDGRVAHSLTGEANNQMRLRSIDVHALKGKTANFEIVDAESGGWGNIGVGKIVFSDTPVQTGPLEEMPDFGTMGLGLIGGSPVHVSPEATAPLSETLAGEITCASRLDPGQSFTATFIVAWHFPNLAMDKLPGGRFYATRFDSAAGAAAYVAQHFERLAQETQRWHDTWYDSTLPWWFLDRTFLNASILATSTCQLFKNKRFYAWEGVGCCAGTCGHVWQYAHAPARLFPALERDTRERVDFGLALEPDGAIRFRAEHNDIPAVDAQSGAILRAYREHQMSSDDSFLRRNWPAIKAASLWLVSKDANGDGIIESNQHNTLDTDWYGPVAWLSGLYIAALRAAEEMALELGDDGFAQQCRAIYESGKRHIVERLFNGEYFMNKPDPEHRETINSGTGCEIDQVMGQSWAWQVGLGRILPEKETVSALRALWRYNFTPDVGPYRAANKPGRWYAMPGEAGLLMCTFPRADWDYEKAKGRGPDWAAGYFNECMNGFEYQVAGHMLWEGLVQEGLAVTRAVHDRYDARNRNPYNEIECGDHYARSMASYGVYLAACGFECHGPKGHFGFFPRLSPGHFKAAFTGPEGWGSYRQSIDAGRFEAEITVQWGSLSARTLAFAVSRPISQVDVQAAGKHLAFAYRSSPDRLDISFTGVVTLRTGESISIVVC